MELVAIYGLSMVWTLSEAVDFFTPDQTQPPDWRDYLRPDVFNISRWPIFEIDSDTDVATRPPQAFVAWTTSASGRRRTSKRAKSKHSTTAAVPESPMVSQNGYMQTYILRLSPETEIYSALQRYAEDNNLQAAFVITAVGSVSQATLRSGADELKKTIKLFGPRLIVSLVGTISAGGHLHISLADEEGVVLGGHVVGDLIVSGTCEVVIGNTPGAKITRPVDPGTGRPQLVMEPL